MHLDLDTDRHWGKLFIVVVAKQVIVKSLGRGRDHRQALVKKIILEQRQAHNVSTVENRLQRGEKGITY